MKKIILSAAALFVVALSSAQETSTNTGGGDDLGFAKGDIFMSGSIGYRGESTGDFKFNQFNISPRLGFFVSDNIAVGAMIGYESTTNDTFIEVLDDSAEITENMLTLGAFGRWYASPASQFSFFAELGLNYNTMNSETEGIDGELKANGFEIALTPGVSYFISTNFAMEASVGVLSYETSKPDADGAESTDTFELGFNLSQINLGLVYKF